MNESRDALLKPFVLKLAIAATLLALLPALFAFAIQQDGIQYLGTPFNTDDHMVYAAWMKQAQDGAFFFDNRFTTDPQPRQTVHLYFWLLGIISKAFGIVGATTLARVALSFLFVILLAKLVQRTTWDLFTSKFALVLATFGGGLGFLVWHNFGRAIVNGPARLFAPLFGNHLPIDVWQAEAFVFPSMLTNGLFMASLCLVLGIVLTVLDAKDSWQPVIWGVPCMGLLMNIHSYDVLLLGLIFFGLLVTATATRTLSWQWMARVLTICLGIVPSALWFMHVLRVDPVFQSRAATPTYTSGMPTLLGGIASCLVVVAIAFYTSPDSGQRRRMATIAWTIVVAIAGFATYHSENRFLMSWATWAVFTIAGLTFCWVMARKDMVWNLLLAWASLGLFAPFVPEMFQRKLTAGLIIPYGLLGAIGLSELLKRFERQQRNMVAGFFIVLICSSSVLWLRREFELIRDNVSTTTNLPAFLSADGSEIVRLLSKENAPIVVAVPGVRNPVANEQDRFASPAIPDLNPIVSGLAGAYTYAGHWSETPDYGRRHDDSIVSLFANTATPKTQGEFLARSKADFVVSINVENYPNWPYADLSALGEVVYKGNQLILVRVNRN
ncbi:MAG: hypothetical protein JNK63_04495 [Chthonomonas sp.]|nr:hypothetical protein [Chthonomonas sp.]